MAVVAGTVITPILCSGCNNYRVQDAGYPNVLHCVHCGTVMMSVAELTDQWTHIPE